MSGMRLIHFADIHLGFTGPTNLIVTKAESAGAAGRYVREVDIEETVKRMMRDLGHAQPAIDMVVIAVSH
jgi:3',5'-cyclic AMP phosphodiesterase CpdA